jgi:propanol-preferring alcohol dehydrogenase
MLKLLRLLCAGAIGYRSLMLTDLQQGETLALTGFGASGHLVLKMSRHLFQIQKLLYLPKRGRAGFCKIVGCVWSGDVTG